MINLVLESFAVVVDELKERQAANIQRLENAWSEANSNIPPKMDRQGRLHAPCDGYQLPYMNVDYIGNYDEMIFAKGQYLPIPLTGDDYLDHSRFTKASRNAELYRPRGKIKVNEELADQIIAELKDNFYINFTKGKSWSVNDVHVCYMYMTACNQSMLDRFIKAIKDTVENNDRQVYTGEGCEGRVRVKGKVLKRTVQESYGYRGQIEFANKVLILLDNDSTCFGSEPSSVALDAGDVVEFTASFEKSNKDVHHSYYKRPHKMIILEKAVDSKKD